MSVLEFKSHAPVAIHPYRPATPFFPLQRVQPKPWKVTPALDYIGASTWISPERGAAGVELPANCLAVASTLLAFAIAYCCCITSPFTRRKVGAERRSRRSGAIAC